MIQIKSFFSLNQFWEINNTYLFLGVFFFLFFFPSRHPSLLLLDVFSLKILQDAQLIVLTLNTLVKSFRFFKSENEVNTANRVMGKGSILHFTVIMCNSPKQQKKQLLVFEELLLLSCFGSKPGDEACGGLGVSLWQRSKLGVSPALGDGDVGLCPAQPCSSSWE